MRPVCLSLLLAALLVAPVAQADVIINMPGAVASQPATPLTNGAQAGSAVATPQPYSVQRLPNGKAGMNGAVPQYPQVAPQTFPPQTMPNPNAPAFQRPCTQMWCREGLTITLPVVNTPGQYRFVVVADGERYTCTGVLPLPRCGTPASSCDRAGIFVGESGCALAPAMHTFNSLFLEKVPQVVEIDVTIPGRQPVHMAGQVMPQCFYPNGQQCDARPCCQAQVNLGQ